jgi:hypothetical protein
MRPSRRTRISSTTARGRTKSSSFAAAVGSTALILAVRVPVHRAADDGASIMPASPPRSRKPVLGVLVTYGDGHGHLGSRGEQPHNSPTSASPSGTPRESHGYIGIRRHKSARAVK